MSNEVIDIFDKIFNEILDDDLSNSFNRVGEYRVHLSKIVAEGKRKYIQQTEVNKFALGGVMPRFVYRLYERGKCRTYEIGENDNPRTSPKEWCDRRVCEGFWGAEEMCKRVVSLLNGG